jgi:hypothetical protein
MLRETACQAQKTRDLPCRINILQQCSDNGLRSIYEVLFFNEKRMFCDAGLFDETNAFHLL